MPALVAGTHEESGPADRPTDRAGVDQRPRRLVAAAEKRVRGAAEPQSARRGGVGKLSSFRQADAKRLLRIDVLAGGDRSQADLGMGGRHGQVEDDLDRRVGQ